MDSEIDHVVFSPEKVKAALQSFSPLKSYGTDDLKPIVFNHLGPNAVKFITLAMQASYSLGYVLKPWLETKAVFITLTSCAPNSKVGIVGSTSANAVLDRS